MLTLSQFITILIIYLVLLMVILPTYFLVEGDLIDSQILESGKESRKMVERINTILKDTDTYIWQIDANDMVTTSDVIMDMYGFEHKPIPLTIVLAALPRNDRRSLVAALKSEKDSYLEFVATDRKTGDRHALSVNISHAVNADGTVTHMGTMFLLDKKRKIDEEMREAVKLDMQAKTKLSVLASMGHEIRTPLNVILGFSKLLVENRGDLSNEECEDYYNIIEQNNSQLLGLLDSVFIGTGEDEGLKISLSRKNVSDVMEDFFMAHTVIVPNHLKFKFVRGSADDYFMINRSSLLQVVSNLMNNAVKFTKEGCITMGWTSDDQRVTVFVDDTGIGIPLDSRTRVFDKYYKENSSSVGAGIGLPLCKKLVEEMKGTISIVDKSGPGSRFEVSIPKIS